MLRLCSLILIGAVLEMRSRTNLPCLIKLAQNWVKLLYSKTTSNVSFVFPFAQVAEKKIHDSIFLFKKIKRSRHFCHHSLSRCIRNTCAAAFTSFLFNVLINIKYNVINAHLRFLIEEYLQFSYICDLINCGNASSQSAKWSINYTKFFSEYELFILLCHVLKLHKKCLYTAVQ